MATLVKLHFNAAYHFKICYIAVIILGGVVASFPHQIQSEYYGGNISVSIEGIALENFSALPQTEIKSSTKSCPRHAVFYTYLTDDSKQYTATTTTHSKRLIGLFKNIVDVIIR